MRTKLYYVVRNYGNVRDIVFEVGKNTDVREGGTFLGHVGIYEHTKVDVLDANTFEFVKGEFKWDGTWARLLVDGVLIEMTDINPPTPPGGVERRAKPKYILYPR